VKRQLSQKHEDEKKAADRERSAAMKDSGSMMASG
jgi:hypothetical protein